MPVEQRPGFEVVVKRSIGRIEYDALSDHNPMEAAMLLIARDFDPGEYEFPLPDGSMATVTVAYDPPAPRQAEPA